MNKSLEILQKINSIQEAKAFVPYSKRIVPDGKDLVRMQSMIDKSKGDLNKILQYCRNMSKSIKDHDKAIRRGEAALQILPKEISLEACEIFQS